jgi:hypothetical protein
VSSLGCTLIFLPFLIVSESNLLVFLTTINRLDMTIGLGKFSFIFMNALTWCCQDFIASNRLPVIFCFLQDPIYEKN